MTDQELAIKVNEYLAINPYASRFVLRRALNTSEPRLKKLKEMGLLRALPAPMSASQAATYGRKVSNNAWGRKFNI